MLALVALLALPLGVALDGLLGEPRRFHPLIGFGRLARWVERTLHRPSRIAGACAVAVLLLPIGLATVWLMRLPLVGDAAAIALLYLALGYRSLGEHARAVTMALQARDLPAARRQVARMVSRDTSAMQPREIAGASIESVIENGNDAVFGALFWFAVAGAPGAVLYRLANTLDAMWGYRNARYREFGWAAARLDDVLNFVPARLTALSYALCGRSAQALACWRQQAPVWDSPNAGPVMAAGAGALGLSLGGPAMYDGEWEQRPPLGMGRQPQAADIEAALKLVRRSLWLWLGALMVPSVLGTLIWKT